MEQEAWRLRSRLPAADAWPLPEGSDRRGGGLVGE